MFNYELLTDDERMNFDEKFGELVREMMVNISMLPQNEGKTYASSDASNIVYKVNYRVFNIEALCELRLNLIDFINNRK